MKSFFLGIIVLPAALFLIWLVFSLLTGRLPKKRALNIVSSIILMCYFFLVAGTGIFWVAIQELPAFDWHYLPGYILLILCILHISLNWKSLTSFFTSSASSYSKMEKATALKITGWVLLISAFSFVMFAAGGKFYSKTIVVLKNTGELQNLNSKYPEAIPNRHIQGDKHILTLTKFYRDGSSYPASEALKGITWKTRPEVYKHYDTASIIPLPDIKPDADISVIEAYEKSSKYALRYTPSSISLEDLSMILFHTQGINKTVTYPSITFEMRTSPSAGALYPVDIYLLINNVEGVKPGLYHHNVKKNALELVREGELSEELSAAIDNPSLIKNAAFTAIFSVTFSRTGYKYSERCYRYVFMDSGHTAYNLAVSAAVKEFSSQVVTRFDDGALNEFLGVDGITETASFIMPVGKPDSSHSKINEMYTYTLTELNSEQEMDYLTLMNLGTGFVKENQTESYLNNPFRYADIDRTGLLITLPEPAEGMDVLNAIRKRRSIRNYTDKSMSMAELSALCRAAVIGNQTEQPFYNILSPVNLYISIHNVEGLKPGIYMYDETKHGVRLIKEGDFSTRCFLACLQQDFCKAADAVFIKTARWDAMSYPDGDRGYRYANTKAGFIGEGLYLQGTALGIGVCGVGAFYDDNVAALIGIDPSEQTVLYVTAAGK